MSKSMQHRAASPQRQTQPCPHCSVQHRQPTQRTVLPIRTMRFALAIVMVMLAGSLYLTIAFTGNSVVTDKLLPFINQALLLVLCYYFGRAGREQ